MGKKLKKINAPPNKKKVQKNVEKPVENLDETTVDTATTTVRSSPSPSPSPPPPSKLTPLIPTKEEAKRPFVSILCVTYNRRPFIPMFLEMVRNQDYPQSRMEIIIVDDGTDPIGDIIAKASMPNIRYVRVEKKMPLGKKRNYANSLISPQTKYIIPMDDDDVMMSERVSHSVETLEKNPQALCAGSSEMFLYFKHINKLYKFGPYMVEPEAKSKHDAMYHNRNRIGAPLDQYIPIHTNHATNGTFAYRRELLKRTKYNETACLAEEKEFLMGYTVPMVQLNPFKCILCMSHEHNTFDKRKLLENINPMFVQESSRSVDSFFKLPKEAHIKKFFLQDVDPLLKEYDAGLPKMKPDVLKQLKELEEERAKMMQQMNGGGGGPNGQMPSIVVQQPGEAPRQLSLEEVVDLMRQQQLQIEYMTGELTRLQTSMLDYQQRLMDKMLG